MSSSRKAFLGGAAILGMTSLLSEVAVADTSERALIITLWGKPKDPNAFEKHFSTHVALIKQLPGLISYERSTGSITQSPPQSSSFQMITVVAFETMSALNAALESSAGTAVIDDLKNFGSGTYALICSMTST